VPDLRSKILISGPQDNPLFKAFIDAGQQAGYPYTPDMNGFMQEGVGPMDMTVHKGRRWSTATAYLRPALTRTNLSTEVSACVFCFAVRAFLERQTVPDRFFWGVLGARFGSLELKIGSLKSEKIISGSLELERIGSVESEKSGPYRSILGSLTFSLKKTWFQPKHNYSLWDLFDILAGSMVRA